MTTTQQHHTLLWPLWSFAGVRQSKSIPAVCWWTCREISTTPLSSCRLPVTSFKSSITAATAACFSFKPYEQFTNKMTKARLYLIGTLHPMLSYKAENYNVSIAQPWAGCSHFLPHMDLPAAPSRHVNRTHMEKTKTGFITVFSYCGNAFWHFCNLTKLDHTVWWPERHNSS